jgi:hypothetical protein
VTTAFLSQGIWPQITKSIRTSPGRCDVAVAYFGAGASRLLPLPKGSRLVVNASERCVASGQTCPADLIKLVKRGVAVYSVTNLHAKVFVLERAAYIGSANVSNNAASKLVEAVIRTTEPGIVRAARKFVQQHCLHELTPSVLKRLAKLYRPPLIPGREGGKRQGNTKSTSPSLPRLILTQTESENWSKRDQALHDAAMAVAKKRRERPRSFELESFRVTGRCIYQRGDVAILVNDEGGKDRLVAPPGNVLHVRTWLDSGKPVSFVYLERPARRRRRLKVIARELGVTQKQLRRQGVIRNPSFAQALLNIWVDR